MVALQIYLGQVPSSVQERRMLRTHALDLQASLRPAHALEPTYALLNFTAGVQPDVCAVELLLLRPKAIIVGAIRAYPGPIAVLHGGHWILCATGDAIRDHNDLPPLQWVKAQRDAVHAQLNAQAAQLVGEPSFERIVGALICAPTIHADSRISLDVDEHRQLLKILGLDELAGLAAMIRTGPQIDEAGMRLIVTDIFGGQLWHDGAQFLFELAPCRFQLRLLDTSARQESILPLAEGENIVGRRTAHANEHRLTLSGDDLISSDHARLICEEADHVILRDTSKNGTWIALPGHPEEHVQGAERAIVPGTLLRMGLMRLRLEQTPRIASEST
jgi:FHA domain